MSLTDNPNHANRLLFQASLARQKAQEAAINQQFSPPAVSAQQLDHQYTVDLRDRIAAEERALNQWRYEPLPHTPSSLFREQLATELDGTAVVPAKPVRTQLTPEQMKFRLTTAEAVKREIYRRAGVSLPKPAAVTTAPPPTTLSGEPQTGIDLHTGIFALYGRKTFERMIACMRKAGQHKAADANVAALNFQLVIQAAVADGGLELGTLSEDEAAEAASLDDLVTMGVIAPHPYAIAATARSCMATAERVAASMVEDVTAGPGRKRFDLDKWDSLAEKFAGGDL